MSERYPDNIGTDAALDGDDVRVRFEFDDEPTVSVVLDQVRLLQLIALLHERIGTSGLTPISRLQLRAGAAIDVRGHRLEKQADGSALLVLTAIVDDRIVVLPYYLSPESLAALRKEI